MSAIKRLLGYFSKGEIALWISSVLTIVLSWAIFDRTGVLSLFASLIGVTAIIFCAKGNPIGQGLMIIFAVLYAIISFSFSYYGEMITYLCMSGPMAVLGLISWLRNPSSKGKAEVRVGRIHPIEIPLLAIATTAVTVAFYFILGTFGTANILPSTFSVATSFVAVYLTFRRSPFFALAYVFNDLVLILLWIMAAFTDSSYVSVVACFLAFFANDVYGFISWLGMERRQKAEETKKANIVPSGN